MIRPRHPRLTPGSSHDGNGQLTALSLFLLLLAFFIVMNGVTGFAEHRAEPILQSVRQAFGTSIIPLNIGPSLTPGPQRRTGSGLSMEDQIGTFRSEFPGLQANYMAGTGTLQIVMGASVLNRLLGLTGEKGVNPRLKEMIDAAANPDETGGSPYEIIILINRRPEIYAASGGGDAAFDRLIVTWADALLEMGVPAKSLSIGWNSGPAGRVTLIVRQRMIPPRPISEGSQGVDVNASPLDGYGP